MKLPHLFAFAALVLCAGCNSLDNPLADFRILRTGRDTRTFNPQTGEYEWPHNTTPRASGQRSQALRAAPATPAPSSDGRYYDPQKGAFADPTPTL